MPHRWRAPLAFVTLFVLYQAAEGVGEQWLRRAPGARRPRSDGVTFGR